MNGARQQMLETSEIDPSTDTRNSRHKPRNPRQCYVRRGRIFETIPISFSLHIPTFAPADPAPPGLAPPIPDPTVAPTSRSIAITVAARVGVAVGSGSGLRPRSRPSSS